MRPSACLVWQTWSVNTRNSDDGLHDIPGEPILPPKPVFGSSTLPPSFKRRGERDLHESPTLHPITTPLRESYRSVILRASASFPQQNSLNALVEIPERSNASGDRPLTHLSNHFREGLINSRFRSEFCFWASHQGKLCGQPLARAPLPGVSASSGGPRSAPSPRFLRAR